MPLCDSVNNLETVPLSKAKLNEQKGALEDNDSDDSSDCESDRESDDDTDERSDTHKNNDNMR